jgi:multimeric flavodoxin WrbA
MKIVGFVASPRKQGNTALVVDKVLEGARGKGAATKLFCSGDLDIRPCQGCYGCKNGDSGCVVKDDMQKLYGELKSADALVLGSPVYMGQMTAQAKIFTDRLFASHSPRFSPYFKEENAARTKMVLVFTQGNPDSGLFQPYFDYTKELFQVLGFDVKDTQVIAGLRNGPAHERKELQASLYELGASLLL